MKQNITIFFIFIALCSNAQKEYNNWLFGEYCYLSFNIGSPVFMPGCAISSLTQEGCSSISDSAGTLLFYADGEHVFNRIHHAMPNGVGLNSSASATQAALIVKKPLSTTEYYVFTTERGLDSSNGLWYSVVDITLDGGLGDVTVKNFLLDTAMSEKQSAIRHSNGQDYWLIAHKKLENKFLSFRVTPSGVVLTPVVSTTGVTPNGNMGCGTMKSNVAGNKLSVVYYDDCVQTYSFDNSTGIVSFDPANDILYYSSWLYSSAFSPSGQYLYVSYYHPGILYQFDMTQNTLPPVVVGQTPMYMCDLALAPDNKIYVVELWSTYLGAINYPDAQGPMCGYDTNAVSLDSNYISVGLHNFPNDLNFLTSTKEVEKDNLHVSPNPVTNTLRINFPEAEGEVLLTVTDIYGKLNEQVKFKRLNYQLDWSQKSEGLYFLKLQSGNKIRVIKVLKQNSYHE